VGRYGPWSKIGTYERLGGANRNVLMLQRVEWRNKAKKREELEDKRAKGDEEEESWDGGDVRGLCCWGDAPDLTRLSPGRF
jgi:hypothetical protein